MQIHCTQCGGSVSLQEGAHFVTCSFCGSALYVDKSHIVFHFVVTPTVAVEEARGKLKRWMAGNETVKDLDVHAVVEHEELLYFPMWRFVVTADEGENEYSEPASSFAIADIKTVPLSGGDLKFFTPKDFENIPMKQPDVLMDSAVHWLEARGVKKENIKETNLIHVPFYLFKYSYKNQSYQAIVDGASGRILASIFPAKDEIPFIGIALITAIAFFLIGILSPNFLIRLALYLFFAVPLSIFSYTIVKKY